jgi:Uma2 family endonuclease
MAKTVTRTKTTAPYARPKPRKAKASSKPGKIPVKVDHLITEDDTPVDNMFSEKQQRLLTEPLYSSWRPIQPNTKRKRRKFLAAANVGIFAHNQTPDAAIVPDVFISMDVTVHEDWYAKEHRSYFIWEFGKAPELVIEVVSNRKGGELTKKPPKYALCGIPFYVVFDPTHRLGKQTLSFFELRGGVYVPSTKRFWPGIGLGLTLWQGEYEEKEAIWLRWCDKGGRLIYTGAERAHKAETRADNEAARADNEAARADNEAARADNEAARADNEAARADNEAARASQVEERHRALVDKLRVLGLDPDKL